VIFEVKNCCEFALRDTASKFGCEVYALQVGVGHVHLFVGLHPSCFCFCVGWFVEVQFGQSVVLRVFELKGKLWKGHLWSRGKFYRSIGKLMLKQSSTILSSLNTNS